MRQSIVSLILEQYMQTKRFGGNKIEFSVQTRVNNKLWITKCTSPEKKYIDHKLGTCAECLALITWMLQLFKHDSIFPLDKYMQENGVFFFFYYRFKNKTVVNYTDIVFSSIFKEHSIKIA